MTLLTIYDENITDLLSLDATTACDVRVDVTGEGNNEVINTRQLQFNVQELGEVHPLLKYWNDDHINDASVVLMLSIHGKNIETGEVMKTRVGFVDLVSVDVRMDNKDPTLEALHDVLTAIGYKQPFIPYKNSRLTHVLQPCLVSDVKTLMVTQLAVRRNSNLYTHCCGLIDR
jgi:hypothetical protein